MAYFNYHQTAKNLIKQGKLISYHIVDNYKNVSPALLLIFNDDKHPVMPIRQERFEEYLDIIEKQGY